MVGAALAGGLLGSGGMGGGWAVGGAGGAPAVAGGPTGLPQLAQNLFPAGISFPHSTQNGMGSILLGPAAEC
jgi:hypothetical protein